MKAVIVGAGIGGIASALALAMRGWDITVLERAANIGEVGAGLQISPNGLKVLHALGVTPFIENKWFEPERIELRVGRTGRRIFQIPIKNQAQKRWGAKYVQIHRVDLLDGLLAALIARAGDVVQTDCHVTGYTNAHGTPSAICADGRMFDADLIIGADGIRSEIRAQMIGPDKPRFTGNTAWRSVVPMDQLGENVPPSAGCIWAGSSRHAVTTRIRAGRVANFVGIVETDDWTREGWSVQGEKSHALADFDGWDPIIQTIIEKSPNMFRWALFDRAPLKQWSDGNVVLLGDAAHPMLPSMAQGAVQAIEDAYILADTVSSAPSIANGCSHYFEKRIKRTANIQSISARNLRMFHRRGKLTQCLTYAPLWAVGQVAPRMLLAKNDWIYGLDPTQT
ncbi:monooxygenase [Amylibacter ulvae]|uniref:Monooxygenase n=1 Tax=Paramylibacter ulvae TaxID=1651968 RepID=A0ABQ3D1T3_9RHOB|nr:FAD-dependent monooxygenase [Amylibacter ulvae]GHA51047.1 monooxygenase [Amylibacter ulvae]